MRLNFILWYFKGTIQHFGMFSHNHQNLCSHVNRQSKTFARLRFDRCSLCEMGNTSFTRFPRVTTFPGQQPQGFQKPHRGWNRPQVTTHNPNNGDERFTVATPEVTTICSTPSPLLEVETSMSPSAGDADYSSPANNEAAALSIFTKRKIKSIRTEIT